MPTPSNALTQATARVKAMKKTGLSEHKMARTIGVSRIAIRTILKVGAHKTRGKNKRRLLAWIGGGSAASTAAPAAAPASKAAPAAQKTRTRRRRRRAGRPAGVAAPSAAAPTATSVTLELDGGRTIRLVAGDHYVLHNGHLLRRL